MAHGSCLRQEVVDLVKEAVAYKPRDRDHLQVVLHGQPMQLYLVLDCGWWRKIQPNGTMGKPLSPNLMLATVTCLDEMAGLNWKDRPEADDGDNQRVRDPD